jgi:hypothetical protein
VPNRALEPQIGSRPRERRCSPPLAVACHRLSARVRPAPLDQDLTPLINPAPLLNPATISSRWILIQRVRSKMTRINTGQPGQVPRFCKKLLYFLDFTKIPSHSGKFLTFQSLFFVLAQILYKSLHISPCTFYRAYLGRFSSVFRVLYVHAVVSKSRTVLCHYFVLLVLFADCFLFILVVCLYVMIVERRE